MTARFDLARELHPYVGKMWRAEAAADALLAEGWRPPRRTITTMDEVKAITSAAAVRTRHGDILIRDDSEFDHWFHIGTEMDSCFSEYELPATVLFEGEA